MFVNSGLVSLLRLIPQARNDPAGLVTGKDRLQRFVERGKIGTLNPYICYGVDDNIYLRRQSRNAPAPEITNRMAEGSGRGPIVNAGMFSAAGRLGGDP